MPGRRESPPRGLTRGHAGVWAKALPEDKVRWIRWIRREMGDHNSVRPVRDLAADIDHILLICEQEVNLAVHNAQRHCHELDDVKILMGDLERYKVLFQRLPDTVQKIQRRVRIREQRTRDQVNRVSSTTTTTTSTIPKPNEYPSAPPPPVIKTEEEPIPDNDFFPEEIEGGSVGRPKFSFEDVLDDFENSWMKDDDF